MATHGSAGRNDRGAHTTVRLPALAAPRAPDGGARGGSSVAVGDERVEQQQAATHLQLYLEKMVEKKDAQLAQLLEQHRGDMQKLLDKKDEHMQKLLDKKDEQLAKKDENFTQLLARKDAQHREDLAKKDQQLERLLQQHGVATKGAGIVEPESPRTQFRRAVWRGAGAEPRSPRSYNNSTGCCDCGCNRRLRMCLHLWKNRNELVDIFKKGWKEDQGGLAFGLRMGLGLGLGVGLGVAVGWQNALPMPAAVSSPPPTTTRRAHTLSIHYMNTISILSYLSLTSGLFPLSQHGTICHRSLLRCLAACRLGCCWDLFGALYLGAGLTVL